MSTEMAEPPGAIHLYLELRFSVEAAPTGAEGMREAAERIAVAAGAELLGAYSELETRDRDPATEATVWLETTEIDWSDQHLQNRLDVPIIDMLNGSDVFTRHQRGAHSSIARHLRAFDVDSTRQLLAHGSERIAGPVSYDGRKAGTNTMEALREALGVTVPEIPFFSRTSFAFAATLIGPEAAAALFPTTLRRL